MVNRNATKTVDGTLAKKYSKPLCNLHAQQQKLMDDIRMVILFNTQRNVLRISL